MKINERLTATASKDDGGICEIGGVKAANANANAKYRRFAVSKSSVQRSSGDAREKAKQAIRADTLHV